VAAHCLLETEAMKPGNAVRRAIVVLRSEGLKSFWFKLLGEIGYRRLLLLERQLAQPIFGFTPRLAVRIDTLKENEVGDYLAFRPETGRARVTEALRSGQTCFVARHESRIVSAGWIASRRAWINYLGCELELAAGDAYLSDAFTLSAYRGQGIAPALCLRQLQHLRQAGYGRAIRATVPENSSAMHAHAKSGFRPVAVMGTFRIGPWRRCFRRPWVDGR
jgi:GNAT superfamily N-acetyltransferase